MRPPQRITSYVADQLETCEDGKLQQRVDAWRQSAGFVFSQHVCFSVHAPSTPCSVERDQGAKKQGLGIRVRDFHDGTRTGNLFADSREAGSEVARVGWQLLAH
jgi:hypothetical protein